MSTGQSVSVFVWPMQIQSMATLHSCITDVLVLVNNEFCIVSTMCPQASIYDDTSLYGSGYSSRAVSPPIVCQQTLPKGCHHCGLVLWSVAWWVCLLIHSPLNTAGTPLEPALPAAALWWALSPCMSACISHPRPLLTFPLSRTRLPIGRNRTKITNENGNDSFPLQLRC